MCLMSIVTASVALGATTGLSPTRASVQNYAAGSSTPTGTFTWTRFWILGSILCEVLGVLLWQPSIAKRYFKERYNRAIL